MANKEKIDYLLLDIRELETLVAGMRDAEVYPVSFFGQTFDLTHKILKDLHALETAQIEMLRKQMEEHQALIQSIPPSVATPVQTVQEASIAAPAPIPAKPEPVIQEQEIRQELPGEQGLPIKNMLNFLHFGKLTYLFTALKLLMKYPYTKAELVLDNQNRKEYQRGILFSVFMNTRYEGGGFLFCPEAEPCDDFLDICLVEKLPKLMILCVLPTAFFGKHVIFKKMVHIERCKKAVLTMEEAVPIHTDGENAGVKKVVEVSLEEQPLNFIIR